MLFGTYFYILVSSFHLFFCVVDDDQISHITLTVLSAGGPGLVIAGENIETAVAFHPLLWQIYKDIYINEDKEMKVCGLTKIQLYVGKNLARCTFTYLFMYFLNTSD